MDASLDRGQGGEVVPARTRAIGQRRVVTGAVADHRHQRVPQTGHDQLARFPRGCGTPVAVEDLDENRLMVDVVEISLGAVPGDRPHLRRPVVVNRFPSVEGGEAPLRPLVEGIAVRSETAGSEPSTKPLPYLDQQRTRPGAGGWTQPDNLSCR